MMTEQSPQDKLNSKMRWIRGKVQTLQSDVRFVSLSDQVEDLDSDVNKLRERVRELRVKGYVFGKGLETRAQDYARRWVQLKPSVCSQIDIQAPALQRELAALTAQLNQIEANTANPGVALPMAERFEKTLETFASKVSAAQRAVSGSFDSFQGEVTRTKQELDRIEWSMAQIAEACFKLLPAESGILAVKARYSRDAGMDKEDPKGVLYLTDQRLIFEQKEEKATKKFLFIATEKEKVQNQLLDTAIALIEKIETMKKGLFKNEDHLTLTFKHGAPVRMAWFHLDGQDCSAWQGLINRAATHDFDQDRVVAVDQKAVEKVRSAPTKCPNCGAPMTQQVLRGMDSIRCEYCQHAIRL
jgi:predicted nuclease with TOPRIM domain